MIDGVWHPGWFAPDAKGAFRRAPTTFRHRIQEGGAYAPEKARYHLYVSYACPWAHRTLIVRALRGLESVISVSAVDAKMGDDGWTFGAFPAGTTGGGDGADPLYGARCLHEIYAKADASYSGRVTVPVLWDKRTGTLVNNESREVMRLFDTELEAFAEGTSLAPAELVPEIDRVLDAIYEPINNGVYRAGFATTQDAYEEACRGVFTALDEWEATLGRQRFTCGETLTEADVALFTTLLRFDLVYYGHFKCNVRRIADMPNLTRFLREIYEMPKVRDTCHLDAIKTHYYWSHTTVNPHRIVPVGPEAPLKRI